ncbi:MAG: methyltransferase domain-containing protein [Myxococcaceae bacterium]|nr:MAG: methyltransferase domain-containing protein [Myxococcaceae bacterium]
MRLPPPSDDPDYTRVREHDIRELWDPSLEPHVAAAYQARLLALEDLVSERLPSRSRILDVGCAQGTLGLRLAEAGHLVTLLDIRKGHIDYAKARFTAGSVDFRLGRIEEQPDLLGQFDLVLFTEIIEHMHSPSGALTAIWRALKAGGFLIMTTPNAEYVLSSLDSYGSAPQEIIEQSEENSADGDAHRFLYKREELIAVLRSVGFFIVEHRYTMPFWLVGHARTRYLHHALFTLRARPVVVGPRPERSVQPLGRWLCSSQLLVAQRAAAPTAV